MRTVSRVAVGLLCGSIVWLPGRPAGAELTHAARLTAVYDAILAADFDLADRRMAAACPPAPREACLALNATSLWWQILMDPQSPRLDAALAKASTSALDAAHAWTAREPRSAEAWFYLAGAHAPIVQWRALRGQTLTAAREGSRTKSALERALAIDSTLHDAHFGIGLYRYYADVAPAAFRMLRWVFLLPGGNRVEGLRQMLAAREHGQLLAGEADYQLHWIYLWYERNPQRALELVRGLDARYASNPLFLKRIAEIERGYFQDHPASAASWRRLLDRAQRGQVAAASIAEATARFGLAAALDAMFQTDAAVSEIGSALRMPLAAPHGVRASAHLQLGRAYDRLGRRALAVAEYRSAERHAPDDEYGRTMRERAREGIQLVPDARVAEAYRLSIEGLRALERHQPAEARRLLERSTTINPVDPVARFRLARAVRAAGDEQSAVKQLDALVANASSIPAVVRSAVFVEYAALLERSGERTRAIEFYRLARDVAGGAIDARDDARAALQRLAE